LRSPLLLIFVLFFHCAFSQELPPIQNFTPLDYNGENQNWGITQAKDNHIYVANNHNLLEYDGVRWNIYKSPNASVFRSIESRDSIIFTGQYSEFGFWKRDILGKLNYTSISEQLQEPMLEDEEFWNIVTVEDWVLFQSLDRIYSYNVQTKQFKILEAKSNKAHIFKVEGTVYYQNQDRGVYRIENGKPKLVIDAFTLGNAGVVGLYKTEGIFQVSSTGQLIRKINQRKGLNNNTVLALFQDKDDNLWLGLDNGLSVVKMTLE